MLIATPTRLSTPVKEPLELRALVAVKCLGLAVVAQAFSRQSTQNYASMLLLMLQASTRREYQSMIATK
jgi:hypothetical protein